MVRVFGKPDFFITMTCNPKWCEIIDEIGITGKASDHPDLVSQIFYLKLTKILKDIKTGGLGKTIGYCYTIKFQKRGLPHAHILVWLEDKPEHTHQIDHLVCSEIPNPE